MSGYIGTELYSMWLSPITHVTAINHIYTAINESLIANRLSGYQI